MILIEIKFIPLSDGCRYLLMVVDIDVSHSETTVAVVLEKQPF